MSKTAIEVLEFLAKYGKHAVSKKSVSLPPQRVLPFEYVKPLKIKHFVGTTVDEQAEVHAQWRKEDAFKAKLYLKKMQKLDLLQTVPKYSPVELVSAVYQGARGSKEKGTQAAHRMARTILLHGMPLDYYVPVTAPLFADAVRGLFGATDEVFSIINEADSLLEIKGAAELLGVATTQLLWSPSTTSGTRVDFDMLMREHRLYTEYLDGVHELALQHVDKSLVGKVLGKEAREKLELKRGVLVISQRQNRDYEPDLYNRALVQTIDEMIEDEIVGTILKKKGKKKSPVIEEID